MRKIVNVTSLLLLLLLVGICLSCEKIDSFQEQNFAHSKSNSKPERSILMREVNYYVSKWSNLDPSALGLKELLAKIILDQQNGIVEKSVIHLIADINTGNAYNINVPAYTTIEGGNEPYGDDGIVIRCNPPKYKALFIVKGRDVCFRGLRIIGPYPYYYYNASYHQITGIQFLNTADNGKIMYCDVSGFTHAAVAFESINNEVYGNRIHDNYMFKIDVTTAYGILVSGGADAYVHHNYFDNNQHAIAGGGKNGLGVESSYEAYYNVFQDSENKMWDHCLDMHGNEDDPYAGNKILIHENIFYYSAPRTSAIIIRGVPQMYCKVYNNAFVNDKNINSAVRQLFEFSQNHIPSRPLNMYVWDNVCDGYPGDPYTPTKWTPGI